MRLHYDTSISADPAPLVLINEQGLDEKRLRVEIHIRSEPDETATLLAFSGPDGTSPPAKELQQGPYQLYDQAIAAKRAIAAQLQSEGFQVAEDQYAHWSMAAQRNINDTREKKQAAAGDYRFDPKDVYLDW